MNVLSKDMEFSSNNIKSIDIHKCSFFGQRNNSTDFCWKFDLK